MNKIFSTILFICILNGCSFNHIREQDIKKYGIHYEYDKLHKIGINAITYDEDGTIHFYVDKVTAQTKDQIDKELIKIFGRKIDYILHEQKLESIN
ncbi:hypothetical protein V7056_15395 [Bacillus sp. JJ664]